MKTEVQKTECRELTDHELDSVSGGGFWGDVLDVVLLGPILAPKPAH
jgi:bacteriocin-like protein